jgi:hypothetical protein
MKSALVASLPMLAAAGLGKDTYAMSHPFAFKEFMETYFPTAENMIQANSTSTCVEWAKLCIDDGHMQSCSGPQGNFQMHAVGAYKRESGSKSMEQLESEFSQGMGDLSKYDPMMENHIAFLTSNLAHYTSAFDAANVPYFSSTFSDSSNTKYESILVQVPGSLAAGAKSLINMEIVATASSVLTGQVHEHSMPRVSQLALDKAHVQLAAAPRQVSSDGKPVLTKLHRSFASSDLDRDTQYFESVWQGSKVSSSSDAQGKSYSGLMVSGDTMEIRYMQPSSETQGPTSVKEWEAYQVDLHNSCFDSDNNQGFDRLADNHIGHALGPQGGPVDPYLKAQIQYGLPYRFYGQPRNPFFYLYAPNGWGLQVTGKCNSASLCPTTASNYNMCTQGITGNCKHDQNSVVV